MRKVLERTRSYPDHSGLAYDVWAPIAKDGKVDLKGKEKWIQHICGLAVPKGYKQAQERWQASFQDGRDVAFEGTTQSRLLIGHGNPAPTEVGITLHHTWGVPIIPGSALKGLTAHFTATCYGADPGEHAPERQPFSGPSYDEYGRVSGPPGDTYARLFGAPAVESNDEIARRGEVVFHDAWWVPKGEDDRYLERDVLTVHQKAYYRDRKQWPSDYDNPNPVEFLSVPVGKTFLIALSCDDAGDREMAAELVRAALSEWGIGGKTNAGYGRIDQDRSIKLPPPKGSPVLREFEDWLQQQKAANVVQGDQLQRIETNWLSRLMKLSMEERKRIASLLDRLVKKASKHKKRCNELTQKLRQPRP